MTNLQQLRGDFKADHMRFCEKWSSNFTVLGLTQPDIDEIFEVILMAHVAGRLAASERLYGLHEYRRELFDGVHKTLQECLDKCFAAADSLPTDKMIVLAKMRAQRRHLLTYENIMQMTAAQLEAWGRG